MRVKVLTLMRGKKIMSNTHLIQTIIEIVLIALVIVSLVYEPAIAKWEEKQKQKVMKAWKNRKKFRGEGTNEKAC